MQAMAAGFITFAFAATPVPWATLTLAPPAPVYLHAAPAPRQLTGWKEILVCSVQHGGPSTEQHFRAIAKRDPFCPIFRPVGGGTVTAIDVELVQWLRLRRKPLGMRRLSEGPGRTNKKGGNRKR